MKFLLLLPLAILAVLTLTEPLHSQERLAKPFIAEGKRWHIGSIETGVNDPELQRWAQASADYMAQVCVQYHHGWEQRFHLLHRACPHLHGFQEIVAESWPWDTEQTAPWEMFNSWRQSSGHWETANKRNVAYGYAITKGRNGIYYGCGIIAQRRAK